MFTASALKNSPLETFKLQKSLNIRLKAFPGAEAVGREGGPRNHPRVRGAHRGPARGHAPTCTRACDRLGGPPKGPAWAARARPRRDCPPRAPKSPAPSPGTGVRRSYRGPGRSHRPAVHFCPPGRSEAGSPWGARGALGARLPSGVWVAGGVEGEWGRRGGEGGGGSLEAWLFTQTIFLSGRDANETRSNSPLWGVCVCV